MEIMRNQIVNEKTYNFLRILMSDVGLEIIFPLLCVAIVTFLNNFFRRSVVQLAFLLKYVQQGLKSHQKYFEIIFERKILQKE